MDNIIPHGLGYLFSLFLCPILDTFSLDGSFSWFKESKRPQKAHTYKHGFCVGPELLFPISSQHIHFHLNFSKIENALNNYCTSSSMAFEGVQKFLFWLYKYTVGRFRSIGFGRDSLGRDGEAEMASRRNTQHEGRSAHDPGMTHRGSSSAAYRPTEQLSQAFLEKKYFEQAEELESLLADNKKLASANMALQEDYVASQEELEKLRQHIKSTQTEGDIQIRILLDKIAKWEADIKAGERVKKDLQQAHLEARSLVAQNQELKGQTSKSTQELEKAREELKKLPEMNTHLESLKQEHQRLRKTFQYEKGLNTEKVEQMKMKEKEMVGTYEELERLRAAVANAKKKAQAAQAQTPFGGPYMNPDASYPQPMNSNMGFMNAYGTPHYVGGGAVGEGMIASGGATNPATAANPTWGGSYDAPHK